MKLCQGRDNEMIYNRNSRNAHKDWKQNKIIDPSDKTHNYS
jgi:hypothetical protein